MSDNKWVYIDHISRIKKDGTFHQVLLDGQWQPFSEAVWVKAWFSALGEQEKENLGASGY